MISEKNDIDKNKNNFYQFFTKKIKDIKIKKTLILIR